MDIADEIRKLVDDFTGCHLALYADISSKMVLICKSQTPTPQEMQDNLCFEAAAMFDGQPARLNEAGSPTTAIVATDAGVKLFVRQSPDASDVLCCLCEPGIDIQMLVSAARAKLALIAPTAETEPTPI